MSDEKLDTVVPQYSAKTTAAKGAVDGLQSTAVVTLLAGLVVEWLKSQNPELQIGTAEVAGVIGILSGVIVGGLKAIRNWRKNRDK